MIQKLPTGDFIDLDEVEFAQFIGSRVDLNFRSGTCRHFSGQNLDFIRDQLEKRAMTFVSLGMGQPIVGTVLTTCEPDKGRPQRAENGFPRRNCLYLNTPAELAIRAAVDAVEVAGAHPLLTDAVNLLQAAREKVADYVELADSGASG